MDLVKELELNLPPQWIEKRAPEGPRELWAAPDGSSGILQLSQLGAEEHAFLQEQPDLSIIARSMGLRLGGTERSWGRAGVSQTGQSALGPFGVSTFVEGQFPSMVLWVTVSTHSSLLWTWLGPDPTSAAVREAVQVVLTAHARGNSH